MNRVISKYADKLFFKQWSIGLCTGDIKEIIRKKDFDQNINWLPLNSFDRFQADPFLLKTQDGILSVLHEDFPFDDYYGKISVMTLDKDFKLLNNKLLLDTKSHLSYPFIFIENNCIYIFPEAAHSKKLTCYEYDPVNQTMNSPKVILDLPVLDPTILKSNGKYWLFGNLGGKDSHNKLYIYYSENLLGPYTAHTGNPVKNSLSSSRSAGNFIEVDGTFYRPSQNCVKQYGESISINKLKILNESQFEEEAYMTIRIDRKKHRNGNIHTIHTINVLDNVIAVDGSKWTFAPFEQWKVYLRNRKLEREMKELFSDHTT